MTPPYDGPESGNTDKESGRIAIENLISLELLY